MMTNQLSLLIIHIDYYYYYYYVIATVMGRNYY
jgi:hypothetical protein